MLLTVRPFPRGRDHAGSAAGCGKRALAVILLGVLLAGCGMNAAGPSGAQGTCKDSKTKDGITVTLVTAPCPFKGGTAGTAHITVKDSSGALVKDAKVKVSSAMPSMDMSGGGHMASPSGDGYESKLVLGMSGDWVVRVRVTPPSEAPVEVPFEIAAE